MALAPVHEAIAFSKNNEMDLKEQLNLAKRKRKSRGFNFTITFIEGDFQASLVEYKEKHDIDLIVMGFRSL